MKMRLNFLPNDPVERLDRMFDIVAALFVLFTVFTTVVMVFYSLAMSRYVDLLRGALP